MVLGREEEDFSFFFSFCMFRSFSSSFYFRNYFRFYSSIKISVNNSLSNSTCIIPNTDDVLKKTFSDDSFIKLLNNTFPSSCSPQLLYSNDNKSCKLLLNLKKDCNSKEFRGLIHNSIQELRKHNITKASISIDDFNIKGLSKEDLIDHITRTSILSSYEFTNYKKPKNPLFEHLEIISSSLDKDTIENIVKEAQIITEGTLFARDLGNEQADVANPEYLESVASKIAEENSNFTLKVIKGNEAKNKGLHMLYAVGQAAQWEPRLIMLEYKPLKESNEIPTVLLGKGITFDTGGLNLKPTNFIEDMHMDMCGAATILGTAKAVSKLNIQKNIVFTIAVAENSISEKAYKPGAILNSYSGKTVEVGNTDAEGRLVLADALSYTQEQYKPKHIIDLATLTGACVVALGEYSAGIFSNKESFQKEICTAGNDVLENCWPLPIFPEHSEELESTNADIKSTGKDRYGGASTAAAFLQKFINDNVNWVHMDIAGPAMYSSQRSYMPKGSTGFGVQTLIKYLKK